MPLYEIIGNKHLRWEDGALVSYGRGDLIEMDEKAGDGVYAFKMRRVRDPNAVASVPEVIKEAPPAEVEEQADVKAAAARSEETDEAGEGETEEDDEVDEFEDDGTTPGAVDPETFADLSDLRPQSASAKIRRLETLEEVVAALTWEQGDRNRPSVVKAAKERLDELSE